MIKFSKEVDCPDVHGQMIGENLLAQLKKMGLNQDRDVVILGLMTDPVSDSQLATFKKRYGLDYPVIRVSPEVSEAFGNPKALPTNFVYNRTGHLVFDSPGAISAGALEREIKQLL